MPTAEEQIEAMIDRLYFEMGDLTLKQVEKYASKTQKKLAAANAGFFTTLAGLIIDSVDHPDFGSYSLSWTSLSFKYLKWKHSLGMSGNFFIYDGRLGSQLRALDNMDILGVPEVVISGGVSQGSRNVIMRVNKRGVQYAFNTSTGRFAKRDDVFQHIPRALSVKAFPKIQDQLDALSLNSRSGAIEALIFANAPEVMYKLAGRAIRGRGISNSGSSRHSVKGEVDISHAQRGVLRPIIGPFIQWWFDTKIRKVVEGIK